MRPTLISQLRPGIEVSLSRVHHGHDVDCRGPSKNLASRLRDLSCIEMDLRQQSDSATRYLAIFFQPRKLLTWGSL